MHLPQKVLNQFVFFIGILEPPEAKKLFVKGFPEDMSNDMVEKLLKVIKNLKIQRNSVH
jgi:hypothetical protein